MIHCHTANTNSEEKMNKMAHNRLISCFSMEIALRSAIALNRSFFNTQRMVLQYVSNAYFG